MASSHPAELEADILKSKSRGLNRRGWRPRHPAACEGHLQKVSWFKTVGCPRHPAKYNYIFLPFRRNFIYICILA